MSDGFERIAALGGQRAPPGRRSQRKNAQSVSPVSEGVTLMPEYGPLVENGDAGRARRR